MSSNEIKKYSSHQKTTTGLMNRDGNLTQYNPSSQLYSRNFPHSQKDIIASEGNQNRIKEII